MSERGVGPDNLINNCSLSNVCGGCFYCNEVYKEQLAVKENKVRELLNSAGTGEYEFEGILRSPSVFAYRNKMEYSFGDMSKDGVLTLGLHRKRSFYDVFDTDSCLLVHDDLNIIIRAVGNYFRASKVTYNDKKSHKGYLRHLLVRRAVNTGEILVDLITTSQRPVRVIRHSDIFARDLLIAGDELNPVYGAEYADEGLLIKGFTDTVLGLERSGSLKGKVRGILHTVNDSLSDTVRDDGTQILYGSDSITEELLGLKFRISPFSFFQTNTRAAEVLYTKVREYAADKLSRGVTVYDLYSGTGTIAQILAPYVQRSVGVEIVEEAVSAARVNSAGNGLGNCDFIADDVLRALDYLPPPDIIIVDPPRDGVNHKALRKLTAYGVNDIVYVSCRPESLLRDLVILKSAGYRLVKAVAVDQFPWTNNVEAVALISRT